MLIEDFDGEYCIDYLRTGAHIGKILFGEPEPDYKDLIDEQGRAIDELFERNDLKIKGNHGIRQKYVWAKQYHDHLSDRI